MSRNLRYFNNNRIVYKRDPITDKPTHETKQYMFFEQGTNECYHLFTSKAKITTFKSLKWHLLVLWYLNPKLEPDDFQHLAEVICYRENGFITFNVSQQLLKQIIYDVSMHDLEEPPKNKLRKIIFDPTCGLDIDAKLAIVGALIGRTKRIHEDDIYAVMLDLNENNEQITISKIAKVLECTTRTIHRNMGNELKKEKELLNQNL